MRTERSTFISERGDVAQSSESGQAALSIILILGIFLLGVPGFGVDLTNVWFHRQATVAASDAVCQAGAMEMLALSGGLTPPAAGFTVGRQATVWADRWPPCAPTQNSMATMAGV